MSIRTINLATYKQLFNVSLQNKNKYGEVNTDFSLVSKITHSHRHECGKRES